MPTEIDWLDRLADETGIGYEPLVAMIGAILEAEDAADVTDDGVEYAGFNGEVKGLIKAMRFLEAEKNTIVEAIRQARREREA